MRPPRDPSGAPRARGGLGAGARFGGRSGAGRLQFALYHTWRLEDSVVIRDGLPELDLLDGAAVGSGGGRPEHEFDLQAGVSRRGLGARLEANWRAGTVVRGGAAAGLSAGDLAFDDRTTVNLNLFADLGQRRNLVSAYPWLRGARLSLAVTNLLDSRQDVRDETGAVPAGYLPDRLDPVGRSVRFTVRKLAF